jgi:hypothetical protein
LGTAMVTTPDLVRPVNVERAEIGCPERRPRVVHP